MALSIDFTGQTILVTGGTRGIGKAIVKSFLDCGSKFVIVTGTNSVAPSWVLEHPEKHRIIYLSLNFSVDDINQKLNMLMKRYKKIDVCVNNAGINSTYPIEDFPEEKINSILEVNLKAPLLVAKAVVPVMKKQGYGRIINITSIFGVVSKAHRSVYTATKSGLIGVTRTLALELAQHGILVNAISPGFFDTELTRRVLGDEGMEAMRKRVPLKKLGNPQWISEAVLFLASKNNQYITGQNLIIDGGYVCE